MKHLNTIKIAAFAFMACLLMNSCSTNNEFSKQKYTNFKHSKHSINLANNDKHFKKIAKKEVKIATPAQVADLTVSDQKITVTPLTQVAPVEQPKAAPTPNPTEPKMAVSTTKPASRIGKFATLRAFKATTSELKKGNLPASDVDVVILVILALLIPPLAVFLKEGATSRFVLDLILALIGVFGWWFFPFAGLAYLVAIIYALLIVLNAI